MPQVVCYKANYFSYHIALHLVKDIQYISLVNLIADDQVVTELIQNDFNPERLEQEFSLITTNEGNRQRMKEEYTTMRTLLGDGGASQRTADTIIQLIKQ